MIALGLAGRHEAARRELAAHRHAAEIETFEVYADTLADWLDRRSPAILERTSRLSALKIMEDPEAVFQIGWLLCDAGMHREGLDHLRRGVDKGYAVATTLAGARAFDGLRSDPAFQAILARAEADRTQALAAFRENGGERLLGR